MTQGKSLEKVEKPSRYFVTAGFIYAALAGLSTPVLSDEVFSLATSSLSMPALLDALRLDVHPPLYYLLLHLWLTAAPATEAGLRLFSGLALTLTGWLFWRFLSEAAPEVAWTGTTLLLANPLILLLAGYGRMYTLVAALCGSSLWAAWRVLRQPQGTARAELALLFCTTAGLLTHNWFSFYLIGLGTAALTESGRRAFRLALPVFGGGFLYIALWGDAAFAQISARGEQLSWLKVPGWAAPLEALAVHLWLLAVLAPVFLILVALRGARPRTSTSWLPAAAGAAATLLIPLLISQWKPIYNPRFTVVAAPFLAWALAGVVARVGSLAAPVLVLAACLWTTVDAQRVSSCNSRAAAEVLAQNTVPGDTVIFCRLTRQPVEWYWKTAQAHRTSFPAEIDSHPGYEGTPKPTALQSEAEHLLEQAPGRVIVVADTTSPSSQILLAALHARYRPIQPPCLACDSPGKHYFNQLSIFEKTASAP